jgi:hypothetical protein
VLRIQGVVYFDGELVLDNNQQATYDGRGTIYVVWKAAVRNSTSLCAVADCVTTGWDPSTDLVTFVIGSAGAPAFDLSNSPSSRGGLRCRRVSCSRTTPGCRGPVVADSIDAQNSGLSTTWAPLTSLPEGMPVNNSALVPPSVRYLTNSWRG